MPTRKRPVTWQDFEAEARHCIELASSPYGEIFGEDELMRKAKKALEKARLLKALEDLHA